MKGIKLTLVALIIVTTIAVAQHDTRSVHRKDMKEALALTDEQDVKIKSIREMYRLQFKELKENSALSSIELRTEIKKLSERRNAEFQAVLSEAQYSQWVKLKEQRNHDRKGRRNKNIQQGEE